jgi:hypothetical protein
MLRANAYSEKLTSPGAQALLGHPHGGSAAGDQAAEPPLETPSRRLGARAIGRVQEYAFALAQC